MLRSVLNEFTIKLRIVEKAVAKFIGIYGPKNGDLIPNLGELAKTS